MPSLIDQVARVVTSHNGTATHIKRTGGGAAGSVEADCAPGESGFGGGSNGHSGPGFGGGDSPSPVQGAGANSQPGGGDYGGGDHDMPEMPDIPKVVGEMSKWLKPTPTPQPQQPVRRAFAGIADRGSPRPSAAVVRCALAPLLTR